MCCIAGRGSRVAASLAPLTPACHFHEETAMSDGTMGRRAFLEHATVGCVVLAAPRRLPGLAPGVSGPAGQLAAPSELGEATIAGLQAGLRAGKYLAGSLGT